MAWPFGMAWSGRGMEVQEGRLVAVRHLWIDISDPAWSFGQGRSALWLDIGRSAWVARHRGSHGSPDMVVRSESLGVVVQSGWLDNDDSALEIVRPKGLAKCGSVLMWFGIEHPSA